MKKTLNLYTKFIFLVLSISTFAQKSDKAISKLESQYLKGSYKASYRSASKIVLSPDLSPYQKAIVYFDLAQAAEANYKYSEIDEHIKLGIEEIAKIQLDSTLLIAKAYEKASLAYLNFSKIEKAIEYIEKASSKAASVTNAKKDLAHINYTKAQIYFKAGFYNEALASNLDAENQYKELFATPEKSKKGRKKLKEDYAYVLNLKNEIMLAKGLYKKADSSIISSQNWIKSNLGKRNFNYRNNIVAQAKSQKIKGNNKYAIKYFEAANKYTKFRPLERTGQQVQEELIVLYYIKNKKHESIKQRIKFERKVKYSFGKNSLAYARYRLQEVEQLYYDSKYDKAERKLNAIYKTQTKFYENHPVRFNLLDMKIKLAIRRSNYDVALDSLQKVVALKRMYFGSSSPEYHKSLLRLSEFYTNYANNFTAAKAINEKSFTNIVAPQLTQENKSYVEYLQQLANLYDLTEKYELSIKYLTDASNIIKANYGENNAEYAKDLEKMASVLLKKGEFSKAEEVIKKAVDIFKNSSSDKSSNLDKSATYLTLAKLYGTLGNYEEAEAAIAKAAKLSKKSRAKNITSTAKSSDELAILYIKQGRYSDAEELLNSSILLTESKLGKENRDLITPLNTMGQLNLITGNYPAAEKFIRRAMSITARIFTENSIKYTESLRLLEKLYVELGDYKQAENVALQVIEIQKNLLGKNHIDLASSITQLAQIKIYTGGNISESEVLLRDALQIVKFNLGDRNPLYAEQLKYLAVLKIEDKKFSKADSMLNVADEIYVEKLGSSNINSAEIAFLRANIAFLSGDYNLSIKKYSESRNAYAKLFSSKHPSYVRATGKLAKAYYMSGDYNKALKLLNETTSNYLEFTKKYFPSLSFSEKSKYWAQIKDDFEFYNSLAFKVIDKNPDVAGAMYNNIMATKALLLSSSIKVKQRILNSKDDKLIAKYTEWTNKKQILVSAFSMSNEAQQEAGLDPERLQKEINILEKELSESSELFAENKENKNPSWNSLKASLADNEYAVEILRYRYFDKNFTDSIVYAALIVSNKTSKAPEVVLLPGGKKLETKFLKYYKNVVINKLDNDDYSYSIYWKPIKNKIPDGATVYFSAEGVYNELNLESLQENENKYAIDRNTFVTVSNTKDLLNRAQKAKDEDKGKLVASKVTLFGNPTFYASASQKKIADKSEDRAIAKMNIYASASENVIAQLPGTEIEVNEINTLFENKGWKINKYITDNADEDSIKLVKNPRILHIATHGYFNPNSEESNDELSGAAAEFSANPLLRSGLLLKGAGDVLKTNNSLKINSENGILTAYEAMDLNLDNTDLVVLSACETGKGEVQIGEGVFGLQRAILVSGAKTMVMTLFKVNDDITKELMINFYKKWLETGELRSSFNQAKIEIKNKYKYPVYWGSFVMVGLE